MLDKKVAIRSTSTEFADGLRRLLHSFLLLTGDGIEPDVIFSIVVAAPSRNRTVRPFHFVYRDDFRVGRTTNLQYLYRLLEWQTNVFIGEHVENYLLLHSGAIARNGAGIILPAPSESGKTSLTMALTLKGYRYMSDEFAVIDSSAGELHPFPKPLSVKNTSVFPSLALREEIWIGPDPEGQPDEIPVWYTHPQDFIDSSCSDAMPTDNPVPVGYILFPRYAPSEKPRLEPLKPGEAVRSLIENSVNFHRFGGEGLHILTRLAQSAQCFALTINGLDTTTELIDDLTSKNPY